MRQIQGIELWIGNAADIRDMSKIHSSGIEAIVDLAMDELPAYVTRDLVYCRFPILDGAGNSAWLLRSAVSTVCELIRSGVPTILSCSAGMSRSLCIAAAAISQVRQVAPSDALMLTTRAAASDISPALWSDIMNTLDV